jgi:hypothetical protein
MRGASPEKQAALYRLIKLLKLQRRKINEH